MEEEQQCIICNQIKNLKQDFYLHKNNVREPICKDCLFSLFDLDSMFQLFDIPFIEQEWEKTWEKVPKAANLKLIFGIYLRLMRFPSWRSFTYADTKILNEWNKYQKEGE